MKAYRNNGKIIIEIDETALIDAGPQHPTAPYRVTDRESFLNHVTDQLCDYGDNGDNHSCSDLTRLIDDCAEDAVICGFGVEVEEDEEENEQQPAKE